MRQYTDNSATWNTLLTMTGLPHAGDAERPRPMEQVNLDDFRQRLENQHGAIRRVVHDALYLIFWNDRVRVPTEQGLRVPADHLWWVATPGDTVLLSDGVTHHYTSVGRVDRDADTISFADPWPADFFLQKHRNVLGIEAQGTVITRADFARATTGVLTWDTARLIDAYLETFPRQQDPIDQRLRAGHAIMNVGPEQLAAHAVKHFVAALRLAHQASDERRTLRAAACAWLAGSCAMAPAMASGNQQAVALLEQMVEPARRLAKPQVLLEHLVPDELCRLANAAGQTGGLPLAEAATSVAIQKDPGFEYAYWLRAIARVRANPGAAAEDARRALELNRHALAKLETEVAHLGRGPVDAGMTRTRLAERRHRRVQELNTLVAACANGGDHRAARDAVLELCALTPNDVAVLHKRFVLERLLGNASGLLEAAHALTPLDLPPDLRKEVESVLAQN
jgi:hypothetical protein